MQSEKIFPSDLIAGQKEFQDSQLVLPLFSSHSEAKQQLVQQTKNGQVWRLTQQHQRWFVALERTAKKAVLTNLLHYPLDQLSWRNSLTIVETFLRQQFIEEILLPVALGPALSEWLLTQGYTETSAGFHKKLIYHTALVLGGGGARGAYQIGVWQALKSEGISFEWITGTSVGALNGALFLMDDVAIARDLWLTISTDKVLAFPEASATNQSLKELLLQVNSLAATALREKGASSKPLQELLINTFDAEKMQRHPAKLLVCTTRWPQLQEVVHTFAVEKGAAELDWLVASSSFYPGMQALEIAGELYVDGGYRNNLPLDVALAQGATECICIDVKGPGIVKKTPVPPNVARIDFRSPWSLGNLLVFDSARSEANYRLGYLETLKSFGHFSGHWYTFSNACDWQKEWRHFLRSLKTEPLYRDVIKSPEFWKKVAKVYGSKAPIEQGGQIFIELIGRFLNLAPTHVYTRDTFLAQLQKNYQEEKAALVGTLSITEWLQQYHQQRFILSEKNQLIRLYQSLQEKENLPASVLSLAPIAVVAAKFLAYVLKEQ